MYLIRVMKSFYSVRIFGTFEYIQWHTDDQDGCLKKCEIKKGNSMHCMKVKWMLYRNGREGDETHRW